MNFPSPTSNGFLFLFVCSFLTVFFLDMAGCATSPVPVAYNCPRTILPDDPKQNPYFLTSKSSPDEVMKSWVITALAYREWNKAVHTEIENSV